MRFALFGYSEAVDHLLQQLGSAPHHELVAVVLDAESGGESAPPLPAPLPHVPWESLLAAPDEVDAIIVGDAEPASCQEALRKLTQAGLPLIIAYPSCDVILAFELEMIRRDVGGTLLPYFAGIHDKAFASLAQWSPTHDEVLAGGSTKRTGVPIAPCGHIRQVAMQRHTQSNDRQTVEQQFAQDAYWLRKLLGPFDRLGALGPQAEDDLTNLSVHMSAERVLVKWSLLLASDPSPTTLAIIGDDNTAQLTLDEETGTWSLQFTRASDPATGAEVGTDSDLAAIVKLLHDPTAAGTDWECACRALELVETVVRSLRRGKTVELHNEDVTEENTFKSLMAAGGCGALLLALTAILLMAVIETLEIPLLEADFFHHWPGKLFYWRNWPIYLAGALALFLGLQLFKFAFSTRNPPD